MNFEFLSPAGRGAMVAAQRLARGRDEEQVELEHLLSALMEAPATEGILGRAGADLTALRDRLRQAMAGFRKVPGAQVYLGEEVLRVLDLAQAEAQDRGDHKVAPEHLLVSIPLEPRSTAATLLRDVGVTLPTLEALLPKKKPAVSADAGTSAPPSPAPPQERWQPVVLQKYARDLTALAAQGKLDPVVGRNEEIRRLVQILGRRTKNNPLLVGDPGVGKSALVEGLAMRIAAGDVPTHLQRRRIYSFDVGALVAGARFRGEFEDRVRAVLAEVRDSGGEALLFFDEIHALVGAGKGEGSLDAASLLKPALARGEISCLGATTVDEYRLHIEKDPAFERRFQPVPVGEPTESECVAMLRGVKGRYEERHHVHIEDGALVAAVALGRRYVADRCLPDKAIDLLDEAASRLRLELDSRPDELDALERRVRSLEMELQVLGRDRSADAEERRRQLEEQLGRLRLELEPLHDKWQAEVAAIVAFGDATAAVEAAKHEAEAAERRSELGPAAEIRYGRLPALEKALAEVEAKLHQVQGTDRLLEPAVEPVHVARVVADWTGVPVAKMIEGERQKILEIEARLRGRVVGQDEAVRLVGHAVKRARAGLADPGRPIGSFLFLGPTGVGKTELSKALAEFLFDDEHALVRFDMSEYMEKHAVARLTGAPPGYVGYEEGGQLTEAIRRRPYAVVLLDEVEKAHPDVFNILLALLDDGRLTDSRGRTVTFGNVVLIMTSNLGSHAILAAAESGDHVQVATGVKEALRGHFRPEFLNRIDEVVTFRPLGRPEIEAIVDLQLGRLRKLLGDQKITIELTPEARALLAEESYDPAFGARPVKRCLQRRLRDPLSEKILEGSIEPGDRVRVERSGQALVFGKAPQLVIEAPRIPWSD